MVIPKPINLSEADIARFWTKVDRAGPDDCWEWTKHRDKGGYGGFYGCNYSKYLAHRVAFVVTNGDTELLVCHHCNNPSCCNPKHLYAGTQKDNIRQCHVEGRAVDNTRAIDNRGEKCSKAKLTKSDVCEIRALRVDGWLLREIAEKYGIRLTTVSAIIRNKTWKHI